MVEEVKQLGAVRTGAGPLQQRPGVDRRAVVLTRTDRLIELNKPGRRSPSAGFVLARLDKYLGERGYGLPVIGDHSDITAGGFASVGGFSPASLSYGMFVDNIAALEYVNWDGELIRCSNTENRDEFYRVITGTGQYGCSHAHMNIRASTRANHTELERPFYITWRIIELRGDRPRSLLRPTVDGASNGSDLPTPGGNNIRPFSTYKGEARQGGKRCATP